LSKKTEDWFKRRGYLHFDRPISFKKAKSIVQNKQQVAQRSFYPFIHYTIDSFKIHKEKKTLVRKTKSRDIMYASHIDSHIYSYYAQILSARYEKALKVNNIEESVLAFRSLGKSNINFAADAFNEIRLQKNCSAVALDISGFFDNLKHKVLKKTWARILGSVHLPSDHYAVFRSITNYASIDREALYKIFGISPYNPWYERRRVCEPNEFRNIVRKSGLIFKNPNDYGIPQGSPISALLSNIYMVEFDIIMNKLVEKINGRYFRYCDDMLFVVPTDCRDFIEKEASAEIENLEIEINSDKTEIRNFKLTHEGLIADRPLQYLGFLFDGQKTIIRSAALARYSQRMKKGVKLAKKTMDKRNELRIDRGDNPKQIFKKKLYNQYSYLGHKNFLSYGYRASKIMESTAIKKQLKPLWSRLKEEIES